MHHVVIADAEVLVRAGVRSFVPWETLGMEVVAEADSGGKALEAVQAFAPCILLLDISLDDVNVLSEIQKQDLRVKTIVITNRSDYSSVRSAMKLGAYDYLLKSTFQPEELRQLLTALRNELVMRAASEPAGQPVNDVYAFRRLLQAPSEYAAEDLLHQYPTQGYTLCCFSTPKSESGNIDRAFPLIKKIGEDYSQVISFKYVDGQILSIVYHTQDLLWIDKYVRFVVETVGSCLGVPCFAAVSRVETDYANIRRLYEEILVCKELWFYMQRPKIVRWSKEGNDALTLQKDEHIDALLDEMKSAIEYNELEKITRLSGEIFSELKKNSCLLPKIVKNDFINVVNQCTNVLRRLDFPSADIDRLFAYTDIAEKNDVFELEDWMTEFLGKYRTMVLHASDEIVHNEAIMKSIRYLREHYAEKVNLASVAANANLSENYFSSLFKRVVGVNMVEYLNQIRIERAKECFAKNPDMRVSEATYRVGFDSMSYFSKTFKQYAGITAAEYKSRQKRQKNE